MSRAWISPFLEAQAAELNSSENTLQAYGLDLMDVGAFLATRGQDFATATREDL